MKKSNMYISIICTLLLLLLAAAPASAAVLKVHEGESIQAAIDAASDGDIVQVHSGTYNEVLTVNKQLTLEGIEQPVLDASGFKDFGSNAISVMASGVAVRGFKICNAENYCFGLDISGEKALIENNVIENCNQGVWFNSGSDGTVFRKNVVTGCWGWVGLFVSSNGNSIYLNDITNNVGQPVQVAGGVGNIWNSPEDLEYEFQGKSLSGLLGNYLDSYSGVDVDGNGVGDSPSLVDSYPLMQPFAGYISEKEIPAAPWTQFHGNEKHAGFCPSKAPDKNETAWVAEIGAIGSTSVAIADGKVFAYSGPTGFEGGSGDSYLVCIKEVSGEELWRTKIPSPEWSSWSSPAYADGKIFTSTGRYNKCFYAENGTEIWSFENPSGHASCNGGPCIADGKVVCSDWDGNHYYCVYEENGTLCWTFTVTGDAQGTPAYEAGKFYLTSWGYGNGKAGHVYCVDAATGKQVWHCNDINQNCCGSVTIGDGELVYATAYGFYGDAEPSLFAFNKTDGGIVWSAVVQRTDSTPALAYGNLYVCGGCAGFTDSHTCCFNATTGELIWSTTLAPADAGGIGGWTCSVAVADEKVFVGTESGSFFGYSHTYALNASTGQTIWHYPQGGSSPAVSDGGVFTIGDDGKVYAFGDINTGAETGKPDLLIESLIPVSEIGANRSNLFEVKVKNGGGGVAENFKVSLKVDGKVEDTVNVETLKGFKSETLNLNWTPKIPGNYRLTVVVDSEETVPEEAEDNNEFSENFTASVFLPHSGSIDETLFPKKRPVYAGNLRNGALSDFQVSYRSYYDSDMQADFDDVRFAYENGTMIPYWTEAVRDSEYADIWLKLDLPAESTLKIYEYYGHPYAASGSNGTATFRQFVENRAENFKLEPVLSKESGIHYRASVKIPTTSYMHTNFGVGTEEMGSYSLKEHWIHFMAMKNGDTARVFQKVKSGYSDYGDEKYELPINEFLIFDLAIDREAGAVYGTMNGTEVKPYVTALPDKDMGLFLYQKKLGNEAPQGGAEVAWAFAAEYAKYMPTAKAGAEIGDSGGLPDLLPDFVDPKYYVYGQDFEITTAIANHGSPVGESNVSFLVNGKVIDTQKLGPLSECEAETLSFAWLPASPGDYEISVFVDPENAVLESLEDNNAFVRTLEVRAPDLRPDEQIVPARLTISGENELKVYVHNDGSLPAENITVNLLLEDNVLSSCVVNRIDTDGSEYARLYWTPEEIGQYNLSVVVDPADSLLESNESNNAGTYAVEVMGPDLSVEEFGPGKAATGKLNEFRAEIKNRGIANAPGFNVSLLVNGETVDRTFVDGLRKNRKTAVSLRWMPPESGNYTLSLVADPEQALDDPDRKDNSMELNTVVRKPKTWYVDDDAAADFVNVSEAMEAAYPYDTIYIYNGTYDFRVPLKLELCIPYVSIVGEGADLVNIEGDGTSKIYLCASGCRLEGCKFIDFYGIQGRDGARDLIFKNNHFVKPADDGIRVTGGCKNVLIQGNVIEGPKYNGISLYDSSGVVEGNTVRDMTSGTTGIDVSSSKGMVLRNNRVLDSMFRLGAFRIYKCQDLLLENNSMKNIDLVDYGAIQLKGTQDSVVRRNTIENCTGAAVCFFYSSTENNTIMENDILSCESGIYFRSAAKNCNIYLNSFRNVSKAAKGNVIPKSNEWVSTENLEYEYGSQTFEGRLGNYWSNCTGNDTEGDGVFDAPFLLAEGQNDTCPLTSQPGNYRVLGIAPERTKLSFAPIGASVIDGQTTEIELVADSFPTGLAGYNLSIIIEDPSVAEITAIEFPAWANLTASSNLPAALVYMKTFDGHENVEAGAKGIVLGKVTLFGKARGSTPISVSVTQMDDDNGDVMETAVLKGSLEVRTQALPGQEKSPRDLDGDGIYEDFSGNGELSFNDVVLFFDYMEWTQANMPVECFDFNDNGRIDFNDIVILFKEV